MVRRLCWGLLGLVVVGVLAAGVGFWQAGYRVYVVHTGSMMPTYNPGDVVVDRPAGELRPGQVITFRHSARTTDVVTHRITELVDGGIHTKGDANRTADVWTIRPNQVHGVVTGHVPYLGYLLVFFQQPTGAAALVAATFALLLLWRLYFPSGGAPAAAPVPATPTDRDAGAPPTTPQRPAASPGGRHRRPPPSSALDRLRRHTASGRPAPGAVSALRARRVRVASGRGAGQRA